MSQPTDPTLGFRPRRILLRLGVDLRPGEGRTVALLALAFFLIITFQYVAKTVRQSTFIDALGAARLPVVYLLAAIVSWPLLALYIRHADRLSRHRLIAATCGAVSLGVLGFWWLYGFGWTWVPAAFYVFVSVAFVATVSQFWSFASHLLDARQAKRLFGLIGAGGLLGGIAGGQIARLAAVTLGARSALLVAAAFLLGAVGLMVPMSRRQTAGPAPAAAGAGARDRDGAARGGLEVIRVSRHLQLTSVILALSVVVEQIVDLQFNWAVERGTTDLVHRTAWFGNFFSLVSVAALVFQVALTARIHRTLGVGAAMRVLPATLGAGTVALMLAAGAGPEILIAAAVGLKVGESGLRFSLDQATRELLFLPVPARARLKAKAFIDVFVQNGARGVAAVLLLPVVFGLFTPIQAGWLTLVLCVAWLVTAGAAYRTYVHSFRAGLRDRTVDTAAVINLSDVRTVEMLVQSLGSTDQRQVLHSLDILEANGRAHLVPPLLLYHDDAEVRRRTLRILAEVGRRAAAPLVERRLHDDDAEVRAEAIRVLIDLEAGEAAARMLPRLGDPDPRVRGAAVALLLNHGGGGAGERAELALGNMLSDANPAVRAEGMRAIGLIQAARFDDELLRGLEDRDTHVAREAVAAVRRTTERHGANLLFMPRLVSLLHDRRLKSDAREALVAFGPRAVPILVHFMDERGEPILVRRAIPRIVAQIGGAEAVASLAHSLHRVDDTLLRSHIVEALAAHREALESAGLRPVIEAAVGEEARRYLERLADVAALGEGTDLRFEGPLVRYDLRELDLLTQMVAERLEEHIKTMFGLLALILPVRDTWAAWRSLVSGRAALRANALEYLDNTLQGDLRRRVFAAIDDAPVQEKVRAARAYGVTPRNRTEAIARLLEPVGDGAADEGALAAAGLYTVWTGRMEELFAMAARLRDATTGPLVRETAAWVAAQTAAAGGAEGR
jgi:AAA family ATP:ADP antiporter